MGTSVGKGVNIMSKQDRQGVRTPTDIERRYDLKGIDSLKGLSSGQSHKIEQVGQTLAQFIYEVNLKFENIGNIANIQEILADYYKKLEVDTLVEEKYQAIPMWAREPNKPTYTADDVGADGKGTASQLVSAHNTETEAHNDIRLLIQGLTERINTVANSDDVNLDQLSEIVTYIKSNKNLIDGITTSKINYTDIINNLTTNVDNRPLSAAMGVTLKALIDAIVIPTKVSELVNDKGYLTQHQDLSLYAKKSEIPTALSQLSNDKGYLTTADVEAVIERVVLQGYLDGYKFRVGDYNAEEGYITIKKEG